jgi:hypothetical protein
MARSRDIRPEFFTDEKIGDLCYGARILFAAIWCHSDCRGVFEHSPKQLRVLAFPYDEGLTSQQVAEWLATLESLGMVVRFEAGGRTWGAVKHWQRHQAVSRSEVEVWTDRPAPPDWIDPPAWAAWIAAGINNGRRRKRGMPMDQEPESKPGPSSESSQGRSQESTPGPSKGRPSDHPQDHQREHAPSPSPAPSKNPSPSPSPDSAPGRDESQKTPAATATAQLSVRIKSGNIGKIRDAVQSGSLIGLVQAFGGNTDRGEEWARDAGEYQLGTILAVFDWRAKNRQPIREPSGLRAGIEAWHAQPQEFRRRWIAELLADLGLAAQEGAA